MSDAAATDHINGDTTGHATSNRSGQPIGDEGPRPGGGFAGLLRLVATRPGLLGSACLTGSLAAAAGLGPYIAIYAIAQQVLGPEPDMGLVWTWALVGLGLTLAKFVFAMASHSLAHAGAFGILYDLRVRLARKLGRVPLGLFTRRRAGSLQKALMDDVSSLETFLAHMLPDGAAAITVPFVALAVMFVVDWRMALASLVALPFALLAQAAVVGKRSQESYDRYHRADESTKQAVAEYLRGIHVVKTFGRDKQHFGQLEAAVGEMTSYVEDYAERSAPPFVVAMKLLSGGTNALFIVPVGVWLHARGSLDVATLLFFLLVGTQVLSPLLRIANVLGNLQLLLRGADNIQSLLDEPELPQGGGKPMPVTRELRFRAVEFGYGSTPVLHGLNFVAPAGKTTALVGPSGSGKTTVLRLIARFWDVRGGSVELGGVDLRELDLDAHLEGLSLVFQDVFLFRGTVRENLQLASPEASDAELEAACRVARIHEVIAALPQGYDTMLGERGARLSGGEKQRLSLARAVLKDAPVLLLDEATAFADAQSEAEIHAALADITADKTVVVVAHRLETIRHADQIVVLDDGRVADTGPHELLIDRCPLYRELWANYDDAARWSFSGSDAPEGS